MCRTAQETVGCEVNFFLYVEGNTKSGRVLRYSTVLEHNEGKESLKDLLIRAEEYATKNWEFMAQYTKEPLDIDDFSVSVKHFYLIDERKPEDYV